jgi:hypothetical protein
MRTPVVRALAVLCLAGCAVGTLAAQNAAATLKELNATLATSCFGKPTLTLAADGTVVSKSSDGGTVAFNLRDIGEIVIDRPDAQANVLLPCKDGRLCVEWVRSAGATKTTHPRTVFSITPRTPTGDRVLKLFKDLQAASVGAAKK